MKPSRIEKVYALILLVIFGVIVVHAPLSVYFGTLLPGANLLIKSWKEILMLLAVPLAAVVVSRRQLWKELAQDRLLQLAAAYLLLHALIASALLTGPLATMAGLAIDLRFAFFFILVYILMKAVPAYGRQFLYVAAGGAAVVIGFAVLQVFLPPDILKYIGYGEDTIQPYLTVDNNPDFIRRSSTLRGPNPLGAYVVIVIGLICAAALRGRLKLSQSRNALLLGALATCSLVALWISYSRSALAGAVVAMGITASVLVRQWSRRRLSLLIVVAVALGGILLLASGSRFFANVVLHDNPGTGAEVTSDEGRLASIRGGLAGMVRRPLGAGVGSTGSASLFTNSPVIIENQYLFIARETGWAGIVLFLALFAVLLLRLWRQRQDWVSLGVFASGLGLAVIGLVQPVWVDDTVSIIWWGLAAVALGNGGGHDRQPAK